MRVAGVAEIVGKENSPIPGDGVFVEKREILVLHKSCLNAFGAFAASTELELVPGHGNCGICCGGVEGVSSPEGLLVVGRWG